MGHTGYGEQVGQVILTCFIYAELIYFWTTKQPVNSCTVTPVAGEADVTADSIYLQGKD